MQQIFTLCSMFTMANYITGPQLPVPAAVKRTFVITICLLESFNPDPGRGKSGSLFLTYAIATKRATKNFPGYNFKFYFISDHTLAIGREARV